MNFNYQKICSTFFKDLSQRTTDVIGRRFGLKTATPETLESIGKSYGITRERVRQIEADGISKIKPKLKNYQKVFQYFGDILKASGDLKKEDILLGTLGGQKFQNQVLFLLTLADGFERFSENRDFYSLWTINKESVNLAQKVINLTLNKFEKEKRLFSPEELFKIQRDELSEVLTKTLDKNTFYSYLEISKRIQKNPEGQFGLKDWLEINPRGVKDKAYLVFKKEGRPLHFAQISGLIDKLPFPSQRGTHIATVHNELIRDPRFVLVGRGLYALKEWGYEPGVIKDIILKVLKEAKKPLSKEVILEKVLKQRFVKANTVLLNLQDKKYFLKTPQGKYTIKIS